MDREFWTSIAKNDYAIPAGHTLNELKEILFGYLGSTDPELRDDIAYIVYANWLKREMFTKEEVRAHVDELLSNLDKGIGETESDSVFLRTFSVLLLAEIVHNDNKKHLLDKDQIQSILAKGLWYLQAEKDPRGYIPVKGWAHALAHTADLMLVLGKNRQTEKDDLEKILQSIANKLVRSINWAYIHGEDDRLANTVITILQRNLASIDFLKNWLKSFTEPEKSWNGAYTDEGQAKAYHNSRNFLRSLADTIRTTDELPERETTTQLVYEALDNLKPSNREQRINLIMDYKETVKAGYNQIAERYLAERTADSEDVRLLDDFIELLSPHAKVLDAGCGAGFPISSSLADLFDLTGIDFSESQIELARKNIPNATFLCEDITRLKFSENTFDGICSYYAIIHIPREEHQLLLLNFYNMLKTGGVALLCLGATDFVDDIDENYLGTRMYWSHYDSETYLKMLKECGFAMIWSKYVKDGTCEGAGHLFVLVQKK